jgi:type II secretory pathway pseudopilin PulG
MTHSRRHPAPQLRPARTGAFTIVELVVVIAILVLLITIFSPVATEVYYASQRTAGLTTLRQIDGACWMYREDFDAFPPSDGEEYGGREGGQILAMLLTGYPGDADEDATPAEDSNELYEDDGATGFGLRTQRRGRLYGPYGSLEKAEMQSHPGGSVFVDPFGNAVCYYRFDDANDTYYARDNNAAPCQGPADVSSENGYARTADEGYYRKDFLLCTPGRNGQWQRPADGGGDDINNLQLQE